MNPKGDLQNLCMRSGISLPIYHSIQTSDSLPHSPKWQITVILPCGKTFTTVGAGKKRQVEQVVAEMALNYILEDSVISISDNTDINGVILVDIENQANIFKYARELPRNYTIHIIGSHGCPLLDTAVKALPDAELIEVPSTRKNAADIGICLTLMEYILSEKFDKYIILSNDKFAEVLVDCFTHGYMGLKSDVVCYKTVQQLTKKDRLASILV